MNEPPRWRWLGLLTAIDRKLVRDTWRVKTQALAIALLIGCAVATCNAESASVPCAAVA